MLLVGITVRPVSATCHYGSKIGVNHILRPSQLHKGLLTVWQAQEALALTSDARRTLVLLSIPGPWSEQEILMIRAGKRAVFIWLELLGWEKSHGADFIPPELLSILSCQLFCGPP